MKRIAVWGIILLAINVILLGCFFHTRNFFYIDEIFSYGHSNSTQGAFLAPKLDANWHPKNFSDFFFNRWIDGNTLHAYITVQPHETFSVPAVLENLSHGVHPPLFYLLLHTVCSFTPDVFSKWQGAALNIPCWILLLVVLYQMALLFFDDKRYALAATAFYAFSQAGFSTAIYIRGYLLQTLFATLLAYEVAKILLANRAARSQLVKIALYSLLGMLTQYNSIIFSAMLTLAAGSVFLYRRNYKTLFLFWGVMAVSLLGLFLCFPAAKMALFSSNRVYEVVGIIRLFPQLLMYFFVTIVSFFYLREYATMLWSGYWILGAIGAVLLAGRIYSRKQVPLFKNGTVNALLFTLFATAIYARLFMPEMYLYHLRYIMLIMPLAALITVWILVLIGRELLPQKLKKYIPVLLGMIILVNSGCVRFKEKSPFAFYTPTLTGNPFAGKSVVWVTVAPLKIYAAFPFLQEADRFYMPSNQTDIPAIVQALDQADTLVLFNTSVETTEHVVHTNLNDPGNLSAPLMPPAKLPPELENRVRFVKTVKIYQHFYDIYDILPSSGTPAPQAAKQA